MSRVVMKVQNVQSEFECVNHGDELDNEHFAKHTAYFINQFKNDKPYLEVSRVIKFLALFNCTMINKIY